jgi:hypothetical protein
MRWLTLVVVLVAGCDVGTGDPSQDPSATSNPNDPGPEIDGTYLDAQRGACFGGVGGAIRCAGSPCDAMLGETECAATSGCIVTYTEDDAAALAFRSCFPIDARSTAAGTCDTLAADACVTRADCSAVYRGVSIFSSFVRCQPRA